jgi:hypothetical protein
MENEEIARLTAQIKKLQEQQQKFLTYTATQFVQLFAMVETVGDVQRMILAQSSGVSAFPELTAQFQKMMEQHRQKHEQLAKDQLGFLSFLGDKPQGPVA